MQKREGGGGGGGGIGTSVLLRRGECAVATDHHSQRDGCVYKAMGPQIANMQWTF